MAETAAKPPVNASTDMNFVILDMGYSLVVVRKNNVGLRVWFPIHEEAVNHDFVF